MNSVDLTVVASLLANPARAAMLERLLDATAHSAGDLGRWAGVAPSTASGHLESLVKGGLVSAHRQGRHQLYKLSGAPVVRAMEALAVLAPPRPPVSLRRATADSHLRWARTCYDHLAGEVGVAITEGLVARGLLRKRGGEFCLNPLGERRLGDLGVDLQGAKERRRRFAVACLDWSERRPHLAGALGAALCDRLFQLGWIRRRPGSRAVIVTEAGRSGSLPAWLSM